MRVLSLGLLLITSFGLFADEAVWKIDLSERARRRADPAENAARHAAAVANGRQASDAENNVVEGSYDPAVVAPIELMTHIYPVYNLDRERMERFRREWTSRGAAELLGERWWEELRVVFARAISIDSEWQTATAPEPPKQWSDRGECEAEAEALKAGRAAWGDAFDRFLYEVVAPGVYFFTSSSNPELMRDPEHWLEDWRFRENGCR